jgi:hypothetical protein
MQLEGRVWEEDCAQITVVMRMALLSSCVMRHVVTSDSVRHQQPCLPWTTRAYVSSGEEYESNG